MQPSGLTTNHQTHPSAAPHVRTLAPMLLLASAGYVLVAAASAPHRPASEAAAVFIAGAVPGLLVTLLLWLARPHAMSRPLRRAAVGVTLAGSALAAALTHALGG